MHNLIPEEEKLSRIPLYEILLEDFQWVLLDQHTDSEEKVFLDVCMTCECGNYHSIHIPCPL